MAIIGKLLKRVLILHKSVKKVRRKPSAAKQQTKTLIKLLSKAQFTAFGTYHGFSKILSSPHPVKEFQSKVPVFDYNKLYNEWWHKSLEGLEDICWPGKIKYFALSSGTSESTSKRIPITADLLKSNNKTSMRQVMTLAHLNLPEETFTKGVLMLGGSTDLINKGHYLEGDLSGINQANIPTWFHAFYKPGRNIARERDWDKKIEKVVDNAPNWDIAIIAGVPSWIQITLEKIIKRYNLKNIHEIWPNFEVYTHGGVSFQPYKKGFEKLLGKPIQYLETYLASEGFLAYQSRKDAKGMELVLDTGIFFEFIPFNSTNFDDNGLPTENAKILWIDEVNDFEEYAILISTNAGTWRYLIGDTIRFTDLEKHEIIITGRTKHYLSLCGEHLSVDNMNRALNEASEHFNVTVKEFTVVGVPDGTLFAHKWYLGVDEAIDKDEFIDFVDKRLCELNDDYLTERKHALKNIYVEVLPSEIFYNWMKKNGRFGSQSKFPRVLKGERVADWTDYIITNPVKS